MGYNVSYSGGAWRSPASALAWGARGPGFKSQRPDHNEIMGSDRLSCP